jgi:hypothetical protein
MLDQRTSSELELGADGMPVQETKPSLLSIFGRKKKKANPQKPKLFMELSRNEQSKQGKTETAVRQHDGDTLSEKISAFKKTIYFHVKGNVFVMIER